jgi:hypothetical protein
LNKEGFFNFPLLDWTFQEADFLSETVDMSSFRASSFKEKEPNQFGGFGAFGSFGDWGHFWGQF